MGGGSRSVPSLAFPTALRPRPRRGCTFKYLRLKIKCLM